MTAARMKELLALLLIGEGVVGTLNPKGHLRLWEFGPRPLREFVQWCEGRSELLRLVWAAQTGFGLWLAMRQLPAEEPAEKFAEPDHAASAG